MRLSRKDRRRLEAKRRKENKRLKTVRVMSLSTLLLLSQINYAQAGTLDDLKELMGQSGIDAKFSPLEQRTIMLEYARIENHNRIARMLSYTKDIDVNSSVVAESNNLQLKIDEQRKVLHNSFSNGDSVFDVLGEKTNLDNLVYEKSKLKEVVDDIVLNIEPNKWADKYNELMRLTKESEEQEEVGDIGIDLLSPVRDRFSISSTFGPRLHPTQGVVRDHTGLDLRGDTGTDVLSAWEGVVTRIYTTESGGKSIEVTHDKGLKTKYLHLSEFDSVVGQKVKQYDVIGKVGATGEVTGPHLHFEVLIDDSPVNPIYFFGNRGVIALKEYLSNVEDEVFFETSAMTNDLISKIKDRTTNGAKLFEESLKESEVVIGKRPVEYKRSGDVPKNSVPLRLERGYKMPSPSDEIK